MFWTGSLRGARSVSSFCDFQKMTFRDLTAFFSFLIWENLVFQIFLLRSIKAYLYPNIIKFDSVDFNERRPEEVMFLLTLGVLSKDKNSGNRGRTHYHT